MRPRQPPLITVYSILILKRVSVMAEAGQRDVHDAHARHCWAGAGDRLILGYSRGWIVVAAGATMLAAGGAQYGFGAFDLRLATTQHWGPLAVGCSLGAPVQRPRLGDRDRHRAVRAAAPGRAAPAVAVGGRGAADSQQETPAQEVPIA